MTDSKVVDSIKSLSVEEKAGFALFLLSPYFHRGFSVAELTRFYTLILAGLEDNSSQSLEKETVHTAIFPEKPYSEGRMDRIMFELNRLIKVFLLTKNYHREENEVQQMLDYAGIMRSKGVGTSVEKQSQKLKKDKPGGQTESTQNYFSRYLIALEEHEWHSTYNKLKDDLGVPEVLTNLDLFYFSQRLEMLNRFLLQQRATSLAIPNVIQFALEAPPAPRFYLDQSPVLLITEKIHELLLQKQPSTAGFQELMQLLLQYEQRLTADILLQFYSYLRNFCTFLVDAGNTEFVEILHQIHRDNLARGYFYYEGRIQPNAVLNITQYALRVNNVAWAQAFVASHKDKIIGENDSRDFYRMNLAMCLFAERNFEEALDTIPFGSTYSLYHLMARRLELKIYYETKSELLPSKIDAFKMFISRAGNKTFSQNISELFANFGNFVYQLSQSIPGDLKRSEQLVSRIQAKRWVAERAWLLEKARELGESKKK